MFFGNADSKELEEKQSGQEPAGPKPHAYNDEKKSRGEGRGRAKGRGIGRNATKAWDRVECFLITVKYYY